MNIKDYMSYLLLALLTANITHVYAAIECNNPEDIPLVKNSASGESMIQGCATLKGRRQGVDRLSMRFADLTPNTDFTVFLAHSPKVGSLPVQLLGEFRTTKNGTGRLSVVTEILNAYSASNLQGRNCQGESFTDDQGIALSSESDGSARPCHLPGARANNPAMVPLKWIRVYQAQGTPNFINAVGGSVFGGFLEELAGPHVLSSATPFPDAPIPTRRTVCDRNIGDLEFRDPALAACVQRAALARRISCPTDLTRLSCRNRGISDLAGLEELTSLTHINFSKNNINDINALSGLSVLESVNLDENNINDVSPLSQSISNISVLRLRQQNQPGLEQIDALLLLEINQLTLLDLRRNFQLQCSTINQLEKRFGRIVMRRPRACQVDDNELLPPEPPDTIPILPVNRPDRLF